MMAAANRSGSVPSVSATASPASSTARTAVPLRTSPPRAVTNAAAASGKHADRSTAGTIRSLWCAGAAEGAAQHARKDVRRCPFRWRVQGRQAQRLPYGGKGAARCRGEMPGDGFVRGLAEIRARETPVAGHERDAFGPGQAFRAEHAGDDMEGRRRVPRGEGESARSHSAERSQRERQPMEQATGFARRMHGGYQRKRLPVRAQEHVLAVVELDAVDGNTARAAPQRSGLLDDRHRMAGAGERHRRGAPRPAATHHGDARGRRLRHGARSSRRSRACAAA
jgi:hypothetical protein